MKNEKIEIRFAGEDCPVENLIRDYLSRVGFTIKNGENLGRLCDPKVIIIFSDLWVRGLEIAMQVKGADPKIMTVVLLKQASESALRELRSYAQVDLAVNQFPLSTGVLVSKIQKYFRGG